MSLIFGLILILLLIAISVYIALSEIAFAAAREIRIRALAEAGDKRALRFINLRAKSGTVITALQISTNAVSILAGIVGSGALGPLIASGLSTVLPTDVATITADIVAFIIITSAFVMFGDLVPRRVAMMIPERSALLVVGFVEMQIRLLRPIVMVFSSISEWIISLLRIEPDRSDEITTEDFRMILAGGEASGALMKREHQLINNVLALELRSVTSVMTVRDDIVFLDINDSRETQREKVKYHPFSRYPLCDGGLDNVIGSVRAEDVLADAFDTASELELKKIRREMASVPDSLNVWEVLAEFQAQDTGVALVVSEYANVVGIVTFKDLMAPLVLGLANPFEERQIMQRDDQSWLVDGVTPIVDVMSALSLHHIGFEGSFETIGGFVVHRLRRAARKGDRVEAEGYRFEVVDADKMRLNQLLVTKIPAAKAHTSSKTPTDD
ncbi:hemolysin family protein [Devosia sp. MC521]|uniref:hemolysin family protein n=1 Tax=Devosia sp. MC521 TaxID=2759954 RepID=UPI0015F885F3|nr:hemolysin family protein [Devosia sp. MC521]MBJ6989173.1 HlyC/CorC family transporter [Devosia sp. MC521]QMW62290.1 HlyC/CorC family transporter [Devosia sp. MC521]